MANNDQISNIVAHLENLLRSKLSSVVLDKNELAASISPLLPKPVPATDSTLLLQNLIDIKNANGQKEIIDVLLDRISSICRGCGMILLSSGSNTFWPGAGFGLGSEQKAGSIKLPVQIEEDSSVKKAATVGEVIIENTLISNTEKSLYQGLKLSSPSQVAFVPMTINGRVQAIVVADVVTGSIPDPAALAIMVGFAGMVIEQPASKGNNNFTNFPRVTVEAAPAPAREESDDPFPAVEVSPAEKAPEPVAESQAGQQSKPVAEPAVEPKQAPAKETEPEKVQTINLETGGETIDSYSRELESQLGNIDVDTESVELEVEDDDFAQAVSEPAPLEEPPAPETSEEIEFAEEIPVVDEPVLEMEISSDEEIGFLEESDSISIEPEPEPEVAPPPIPEPKPEPEPQVAAKPAAEEAKPQVTYEGLGLSGYNLDQYEGDEKKLHEKAIRFARLLVSEIKLYNEDAVKEGREKKDLANRLRDDITRSRTLYEQRIAADIRSITNYFDDEIVRQLADGDKSLLGE